MGNFIRHFRREEEGVWTCVRPGEAKLPQGRIQVTTGTRFIRGFKFMGLDIARMLDEEYEKHEHSA